MSTREFFIQRWESEQPAFSKVLRAVPEGQLSYRPHERSATAGGLAWQLAGEQKQLVAMLGSGEVRIEFPPHPEKPADIVAAWDRATADLRAALKAADDAKWAGQGKLLMGEGAWSDTIENMCWGYLF